MADEPPDRREAIHRAAIEAFTAEGFRATSMADIAAAADMSRPALYQYFRNKGDIFASAFTALLDEIVATALEALTAPGSAADQLDRYLQRSEGDLWERMAASPHADEIIDAKYEYAAGPAGEAFARLQAGLAAHLATLDRGRSRAARDRRAEWADLLTLAPRGCKLDGPDIETFRRRLTRLANTVAAEIDAVARAEDRQAAATP